MAYTLQQLAGNSAIIITSNDLSSSREASQLVRQVEALLRHHANTIYVVLNFDQFAISFDDLIFEFTSLEPHLKPRPPQTKSQLHLVGVTESIETKTLKLRLGTIADNGNGGMKRFKSVDEALMYIGQHAA